MSFPSDLHTTDSQLSVTSSIEPSKRHRLKIMSPDEASTDLDNNVDSLQDTSSSTKVTNDSESSSSNNTTSGNTHTNENINTFQRQSQKQSQKNKQASPYINVEIVDGTIIHTDNETGFNTVTTAPSFENTSVNNGAQLQSSSKNQFVIWTIRITLQTTRDDTENMCTQLRTQEETREPYHTENLEQQIFCYKRYSEFVVFRNHLIKKLNELLAKTSDNDFVLRKRLQKIKVSELPPPVSWWKCFNYNSINFNKNWLKHRQAGLEFFMCSVLLDKDIVEFCNDDVIKKFILTK